MKSWVEISVGRLQGNLQAVSAATDCEAQILAVIKADGYGHGAALVAPVLRGQGIWFGVTDVQEGVAVRKALAEKDPADAAGAAEASRILVMCGMLAVDAEAIVANDLTAVVWTEAQVEALEAAATAAGHTVRVHVEVDAGMSRQGVAVDDLRALLERVGRSEVVFCEGIFGHLPCAEVVGAASTAAAEAVMAEVVALEKELQNDLLFLHLENTSAVDEGGVAVWFGAAGVGERTQRMVRTGLALYGYTLPLEGALQRVPALRDAVRPVMTWKAPVIGVREIAAGVTVGYGATFTAQRPMRLALLPVGYADGFRREASSGIGDGWVMVNGERAAVVGRVSMNLTVVDVTGIAGVAVGGEAVLLGDGVTADDHARWSGTIAYEILCGVRGRRVLTA